MQSEEKVLESWSDGVLLIQKIHKPECRAPNDWKWRVSFDGNPPPGQPMTERELKGFRGGNITRRVWTMAQIDEEWEAWRQSIVGFTPQETARQLYTINLLAVLLKGAQRDDTYFVNTTLRGDTLSQFGPLVKQYKALHRQKDERRETPTLADSMERLSLSDAS